MIIKSKINFAKHGIALKLLFIALNELLPINAVPLINTLFPQINSNIFDDSSVNSDLFFKDSNLSDSSILHEMTEEEKKIVPDIAITAYESNEEDIEVANLFSTKHDKINSKIRELRSVSPIPIKHKSKIVLKTPVSKHLLKKSLSPALSDLNSFTDIEVISDSDDERDFVRTPNLSPGPIDYFILTDVEDLSEDEGQAKNNNVNEEHTDTENFTDDKCHFSEIEQAEQYFEPSDYFPQPHKEILLHSKDGTISTLPHTEESNPIWLKTATEEVKGFESEEEIITAEEHWELESRPKSNNTYVHEIDVGIVESVETIKNERCKSKYKNRAVSTKKPVVPDAECGRKRIRNKTHCYSEIEECTDKRSDNYKKTALSKYISDPTLNQVTVLAENQNAKVNKIQHHKHKNNNKFVIHDNRNDFSISVEFESHNSVLLSISRDYGNLSLRWYNNGIETGRVMSKCDNLNNLESLKSSYFIKSTAYDPQRQFEVDLFAYGTMKTLQNSYFTYIAVYTIVQPVNIVQFYVNRPFQTQISMVSKPLVKVCSLKDRFTSMERLYPSPVTRLSAFKVFNQIESEKPEEQKKIEFEFQKHVSDVINIFESMCGSPKLGRKFNYKKLSDIDFKQHDVDQKVSCMYAKKYPVIGNY